MGPIVTQLAHRKLAIATQIQPLMRRAYLHEAKIIGVEDFPPLHRTVSDIQQADTLFYGAWQQQQLAAVIEFEETEQQLNIDSLVVEPDCFRQGLASQLLTLSRQLAGGRPLHVETSANNIPAIALYQRHGFTRYRQWSMSPQIDLVALTTEPIAQPALA
ncbi:acetyltransferase (GNAT) family protein [Sinobacterium caligoides]|uniref:Acetyltransferase (GNAT) family protein n=1 Tax=Sinobacterium caligoides TaxID=933926 RepID=A0A3N2E033_9GAMM|nr:GNAT family N-acetyltransferase [Sinobacterium caligoides]ROS05444.1 acetyltransferase (GNAT) family protein [Sinobacterium caligoides]